MAENDRLLTRREVTARTGLPTSTIYRMMRNGAFPEPYRLGAKSVRWSSLEVEGWISNLQKSHGDRAA